MAEQQIRADIARLEQLVQQQAATIANQQQQIQQQQAAHANLGNQIVVAMFQGFTDLATAFSTKGGKGSKGGVAASISLLDTRGIAKPQIFTNKREHWQSWSFRLGNFFEGAYLGFSKTLEWVADEDSPIDDVVGSIDMDGLVEIAQVAKDDVRILSSQFYSALAQLTDGEALDIVRNIEGANGFEAWRLLSKEYDPTGSGRKRTVLSSILRPGSYDDKDLRAAIPRWETRVRIYNRKKKTAGKGGLDDDVLSSVLVDITKGKLRDHLELNIARLTSYKLVKDEIEAVLERRTTDAVDHMDLSAMSGTSSSNTQCYNCGKYGHQKKDCRVRGGGRYGQGGEFSSESFSKGKGKKGKDKGKGGQPFQSHWSPTYQPSKSKGKAKGKGFQAKGKRTDV